MYSYSGIKSIERTLNSKNNDSQNLVAVETSSYMNNQMSYNIGAR